MLKTSIHLAMLTGTGMDFFMELSVADFLDVAKEVAEVGRQKNNLRARTGNRR
jgi:hypothetical protein